MHSGFACKLDMGVYEFMSACKITQRVYAFGFSCKSAALFGGKVVSGWQARVRFGSQVLMRQEPIRATRDRSRPRALLGLSTSASKKD
ncbi:hypothetical protein NDU88_005292 [Pleurodeles waltl]|uniref:Uncharacterized protein n=1 Tax=Pleurodeles waltl TaxID=8319 RepID=A0AAV7TWQ5_PLEWA|nr:hypothetical protein NDU88_005292 [Pleurodeles waltl]